MEGCGVHFSYPSLLPFRLHPPRRLPRVHGDGEALRARGLRGLRRRRAGHAPEPPRARLPRRPREDGEPHGRGRHALARPARVPRRLADDREGQRDPREGAALHAGRADHHGHRRVLLGLPEPVGWFPPALPRRPGAAPRADHPLRPRHHARAGRPRRGPPLPRRAAALPDAVRRLSREPLRRRAHVSRSRRLRPAPRRRGPRRLGRAGPRALRGARAPPPARRGAGGRPRRAPRARARRRAHLARPGDGRGDPRPRRARAHHGAPARRPRLLEVRP
jgi:hypothetical protein